jgi:hypothetical protein
LPCITTWGNSQSQNHPTDSAEEAYFDGDRRHLAASPNPTQLGRTSYAQACETEPNGANLHASTFDE